MTKEEKEIQEETKTELEQGQVTEEDVNIADGEIADEVEYSDEVEQPEKEKKPELTEQERKIVLYRLANDVSEMRVAYAEARSYATTVREMGENNVQTDALGVRRDTDFYVEKNRKFFWLAKGLEIDLNRLLLEGNVTVDELNAFMDNVINDNKETHKETEKPAEE